MIGNVIRDVMGRLLWHGDELKYCPWEERIVRLQQVVVNKSKVGHAYG